MIDVFKVDVSIDLEKFSSYIAIFLKHFDY